jgi:hypothetical protein
VVLGVVQPRRLIRVLERPNRDSHFHFTLSQPSPFPPLSHTPKTQPHNSPFTFTVTMAQSPKKESQDPLIGQSGVGQEPVGQKTDKEQRDGECCGRGEARRGGAWRMLAGH